MSTRANFLIVAVAVLGLAPATASAQSNTAGTALRAQAIGERLIATISDTAPNNERWFRYSVRAGRSYCAETGVYEWSADQTTGYTFNPIVTVYNFDATTTIGLNDNTLSEPLSVLGSRLCWVSEVNQNVFLRLTDTTAGTAYYALRLVETTLFSNWFFLGGDYNAFTLIRNTTNVQVEVTVNWRNGLGAVVGTQTLAVPANGTVFPAGSGIAGAIAASTGSVEVAHDGSPDAIVASTTVLSGTTGLSFDAPFRKRQPW